MLGPGQCLGNSGMISQVALAICRVPDFQETGSLFSPNLLPQTCHRVWDNTQTQVPCVAPSTKLH